MKWEESFNEFWSIYPNKKAKGAARKSWDKIKSQTPGSALQIIEAVKYQKRTSKQWQEGYIPFPATWLNQERWLDETVSTIKQTPVASQEACTSIYKLIGYQDKATYVKHVHSIVENSIIKNANKWKTIYPHNPRIRRYIDMMPFSAKEMLKSLIRKGC